MNLTDSDTPTLLALVIFAIMFVGVAHVALLAAILKKVSGYGFVTEVRKAIKELGDATKQHVQSNAVLALMEQLHDRPELAANLCEYSDQLVAAAIVTRLQGVAHDIETAQAGLSEYERRGASMSFSSSYEREIARMRSRLEALLGDLEAMRTLAGRFGVQASVLPT